MGKIFSGLVLLGIMGVVLVAGIGAWQDSSYGNSCRNRGGTPVEHNGSGDFIGCDLPNGVHDSR